MDFTNPVVLSLMILGVLGVASICGMTCAIIGTGRCNRNVDNASASGETYTKIFDLNFCCGCFHIYWKKLFSGERSGIGHRSSENNNVETPDQVGEIGGIFGAATKGLNPAGLAEAALESGTDLAMHGMSLRHDNKNNPQNNDPSQSNQEQNNSSRNDPSQPNNYNSYHQYPYNPVQNQNYQNVNNYNSFNSKRISEHQIDMPKNYGKFSEEHIKAFAEAKPELSPFEKVVNFFKSKPGKKIKPINQTGIINNYGSIDGYPIIETKNETPENSFEEPSPEIEQIDLTNHNSSIEYEIEIVDPNVNLGAGSNTDIINL